MALATWTEQALDDLDAICLFIARDFPSAAALFAHDTLESTERLASFPQSGRRVPELGRDDIRELIVQGYRVIYRLSGETEVEILTVYHGSRILRSPLGI